MMLGVDVSKYQDSVDFNAMKEQGIEFAFIRAGLGCPDPGQALSRYTDPKFAEDRDRARAARVKVGYYWFSYSKINSPENEANAFCDVVGTPGEGEPLALDLEGTLCADPVGWSKRFLDQVSARLGGYKGGIYISKSVNDEYDWSPLVEAGYWVWIAHWDYKADPQNEVSDWPFVAFEQYSNIGNVGGENPVDLDAFNGTPEQFVKYGYRAPQAPVVPSTPPTPTVDPRDTQIEQMTTQIATMTDEINVLNESIKQKDDQIKDLADRLGKCQSDLTVVFQTSVEQDDEISDHKGVIAELNNKITSNARAEKIGNAILKALSKIGIKLS